jgi:flavin-dependent dehydrogenase
MECVPPQTMSEMTCDVLVAGAGPAGAVAARVLAQQGLQVVLLDSVDSDAPKVGESLPGAVRPMLQTLGLLPWLERSAPRINIGNLSSWGSRQLHATDFIRDPHGPGWHLDRRCFDQNLREAAVQAGALYLKSRVCALRPMPRSMHVRAGELEFTARWVIDASGRARAVTRRLGVAWHRDGALIALYAWGQSRQADSRSVIEAVPDGWWYSAGLPGGQRVLACHVLPAQARRWLRCADEWDTALQQTRHIRHRCAVDASWGAVQSTDAAGGYLASVCGPHWLAVGDAALAFDPLSAQGLYNAIFTGLRGAQAVAAAFIRDELLPLAQYGARLASIRTAYRHAALRYYEQEQRWSHHPFWLARHRV